MLSIKRLSYEEARVLIEGAEAKSIEIGVPMCIAVADESGNLIAFKRMDGSKVLSVSLSQDKAFTAAVSRRGTHEYNAECIPGNLIFGIHTSCNGRFTVLGGGLPVVVDDVVVGGVGLSSGTPVQDMACAQEAIDHFMAR
jgi:uncharacterized protein GlcG (DUF336 family)